MDIVGVIGLGYVGLPLSVEFGKIMPTVGFDINIRRIEELTSGYDRTREVDKQQLNESKKLSFTSDIAKLNEVNFFIVTVPTPIDEFKNPDLRPLESASKTVGQV